MHPSVGFIQGCVLMAVLITSNAYHYPDTYSVNDDIEEDEEENSEETPPSREDYTKYFSGVGHAVSPHVAAASVVTADASAAAGFVQPLDFSHFFGAANFAPPEAARGIIAPPSAGNIFAVQATPVIPGMMSGLIPSIATSATNDNYNHSSHIGFVNPNPNIELQALFDTARTPSGPVYQRTPFVNRFVHPTAILAQPVSSYSMFLPHFESTKQSVTQDVVDGQKQASKNKHKKSPDNEEYYDNTDDEEEEEEDEGSDEDEYYEEPPPQKQASPSEPRPGKADHPKSRPKAKKSAYENPYPYKTEKPTVPKPSPTNRKPVYKQKAQNKKVSPEPDYGYPGVFDYPETGTSKRPTNGQDRPHSKVVRNQPVALYNRQVHSPAGNSYARLVYPHNGPSIMPTFPLTGHTQLTSNSRPAKAIYNADPRPLNAVSFQNGFVPSAPIPFTGRSSQLSFATTSPLEPLPSSIRPADPVVKAHSSEMAKGTKHCTKIEKQPDNDSEKSNGQNMVCYKCHDLTTGANYEQCSYDSETKHKPFFDSNFQSYKTTKSITKPKSTTRTRRDAPYDASFSRDMDVDQSVTLVRKVRQYTEYDDSSHTYETPYSTEDHDNYRFGPEYFVESENSDEESEATQEVPENESSEQCRRVKRKGIICMVCKKPTGGFYEQCSYASDPKANSYSYGTSKTYGHGSNSKGKRNRRFTDLFDIGFLSDAMYNDGSQRKARSSDQKKKPAKDLSEGEPVTEDDYDIHNDNDDEEQHAGDFSESVAKIRKADSKGKLVGLDPFFYGSPEDTFHKTELTGQQKDDNDGEEEEQAATSHRPKLTYDEYFARLFPELQTEGTEKREKNANRKDEIDYDIPEDENEEYNDDEEAETKPEKKKTRPSFDYRSSIPDYFDDAEQSKDLESVLGEFKQKDRSSCKKVMRDKMTCYLCLDEKGLQHEECMFVAASEPKNKHLAYHEVKQFRISPTKKPPSVNAIEDKLSNKKPISFDKQNDHEYQTVKNNNRIRNRQRSITAASDITESSNPIPVDNDSHAAENIDVLKLQTRDSFPMSTVTIQNQRYFSSTGSKRDGKNPPSNRTKRLPTQDHFITAESRPEHRRSPDRHSRHENNAQIEKQRHNNENVTGSYDPIPTDPAHFDAREGPEGAYSEDTEPAFDTVLKITLPKYMLERSEHEAMFDEVLASG